MMVGSNPSMKAYNEDGTYNMESNFSSKVKNALWALSPDESSVSNKTYRIMNNVGAKVIFTKDLSFNSNNSVDYFTVKSFNYWGPASIDESSLNRLGEKEEEEIITRNESGRVLRAVSEGQSFIVTNRRGFRWRGSCHSRSLRPP